MLHKFFGQSAHADQESAFAQSAFLNFFFRGICASLAITICTFVDAVLVGNLVGSNGLTVANLSTPVFLFYGLLGVTLGVGIYISNGFGVGATMLFQGIVMIVYNILLLRDGEYILRIRDNVKTYNPFDSQGDNIDMGVIRLITTKAKYYDYQRKLIFNYLYLIL